MNEGMIDASTEHTLFLRYKPVIPEAYSQREDVHRVTVMFGGCEMAHPKLSLYKDVRGKQ